MKLLYYNQNTPTAVPNLQTQIAHIGRMCPQCELYHTNIPPVI